MGLFNIVLRKQEANALIPPFSIPRDKVLIIIFKNSDKTTAVDTAYSASSLLQMRLRKRAINGDNGREW